MTPDPRVSTGTSHLLRRASILVLLPVLAFAATGCGEPGQGMDAPLPAWTLEEELRIGSVDGSDALASVGAAAVAPDGRIHVLQPRAGNVRIYDTDGTLLDSLGRSGDGPGELRRPGALGFVGDTLWVADSGTRRVTWFGPDGAYVRSQPFPDLVDLQNGLEPGFTGVLPDGRLLIPTSPSFRSPLEDRGHPFPLLAVHPDGGSWDTLAVRHMDHYRMILLGESTRGNQVRRTVMLFTQPFSDTGLLDLSPGGERIAVVDRSVHRGDTARYRVSVVGPGGDTLFSRARSHAPRPVPVPYLDSLVTAWTESGAAEDEIRESLFVPPHLPPASAVVAGQDGTTWVALEEVPGEELVWEVFDAAGEPVGTLSTPPGFVLHEARRDALWGVVTDELDVPYLVRYRVVEDGGS